MNSKTINRGWLKRQIAKGLVAGRCDHHYTDDYAFDAANKFGESDTFVPFVYTGEHYERTPEGTIAICDNDLSTSTGRCYEENGVVYLFIHRNLCYTLRIRAAVRPAKAASAQADFASFITAGAA